jgi:hypothetical protein
VHGEGQGQDRGLCLCCLLDSHAAFAEGRPLSSFRKGNRLEMRAWSEYERCQRLPFPVLGRAGPRWQSTRKQWQQQPQRRLPPPLLEMARAAVMATNTDKRMTMRRTRWGTHTSYSLGLDNVALHFADYFW